MLQADFAARRASGDRLLKLDVLRPAPQDPLPDVRVGIRARAAARVPGARARGDRHRVGYRRVALPPPGRRQPDTPVLFAIARGPRARDARRRHERPAGAASDVTISVWVTVPTYEEAENIDALVPALARRGRRRAHPRRRRRQPRRHRREGRGPGRRAGRHRGAPPPEEDGARQRVPRRPRDRHRPRLRRDGPDRRRSLARSRRAPAICSRRSSAAPTSRSARATCPAARSRTGRKRRLWLSVWGNRYAGFVLDMPVRDSTAGYRAYRASILRAMDFETTHSTGYAFQIEMTYRACAAGGRIDEVPIAFTDRVRGTSKMSCRIVVEAMTLVTLWGLRDRVLPPSPPAQLTRAHRRPPARFRHHGAAARPHSSRIATVLDRAGRHHAPRLGVARVLRDRPARPLRFGLARRVPALTEFTRAGCSSTATPRTTTGKPTSSRRATASSTRPDSSCSG